MLKLQLSGLHCDCSSTSAHFWIYEDEIQCLRCGERYTLEDYLKLIQDQIDPYTEAKKIKVLKFQCVKRTGDTIWLSVFAGTEGQTLQNAGKLILRDDEWELLKSMLSWASMLGRNRLKIEVMDA